MPSPIDQLVHKIREITYQLEALEATFEQLLPPQSPKYPRRPII